MVVVGTEDPNEAGPCPWKSIFSWEKHRNNRHNQPSVEKVQGRFAESSLGTQSRGPRLGQRKGNGEVLVSEECGKDVFRQRTKYEL